MSSSHPSIPLGMTTFPIQILAAWLIEWAQSNELKGAMGTNSFTASRQLSPHPIVLSVEL